MDIDSSTFANSTPVCLMSTKENRPFLENMDAVYNIVKANDSSDELVNNVYLNPGTDGLLGLPELDSSAPAYMNTPTGMLGGMVGDANVYFNGTENVYLHGTQHIMFEINGEHTGNMIDKN
jgi:hypothetical protein